MPCALEPAWCYSKPRLGPCVLARADQSKILFWKTFSNGCPSVRLCIYPPVRLFAARSVSTDISRLMYFGTLISRHLEHGSRPVAPPVTAIIVSQKVVRIWRPRPHQGSLDGCSDLHWKHRYVVVCFRLNKRHEGIEVICPKSSLTLGIVVCVEAPLWRR